MTPLVSPEYDLSFFCSRMISHHLSEIIESTSAEISNARRNHREVTKETDFRKGSKGRKYCDDLRTLLQIFMGSCPKNPTPAFIVSITPLMKYIMTKWEVLNLKEFLLQHKAPPSASAFGNPLCVVVSRQEVESGNIQPSLSILKKLISSPEVARANMEMVDIAFHGYDEHRAELFEIPEVRNYVHSLDSQFPYWLFFLSKQYLGLQCLIHCFLLPYLTDEGKAEHHPKQLESLLTNRWFPAMNQIANFAGLSDEENRRLTERFEMYIQKGRLYS